MIYDGLRSDMLCPHQHCKTIDQDASGTVTQTTFWPAGASSSGVLGLPHSPRKKGCSLIRSPRTLD